MTTRKEALPTPQSMKYAVRRALRSSLLKLGSGTKAELSDRLGISFPTVSKVLEQMAQEGEVTLLGLDESSGGRRANRYAFNPDYMLGLAVYYEKEQSVYTIFNWNGDLIERKAEDGILQLGPEALASQLGSSIHRYPKIRSIAVGMPAAVRDGVIFHVPLYGTFQDYDLKSYLENLFSIPVIVENDMNAAVLGYQSLSRSEEASLVYVYLGHNGPGAGLLINGNVVRGRTFFTGEIGYVPMSKDNNFHDVLDRKSSVMSSLIEPDEEQIDALSRLSAAFTAILNPDAILWCEHNLLPATLLSVKDRASAYVPKRHLPEMLLREWEHDYIAGLQRLALDMMISDTSAM
ncbi:ROK family protein [Paenibacillus lautus]|uniref:ROK family protein n=1 Tax=Paenibacillus lautus TaxID=1401 RepID=UPI003D29058A